MKKIFGLGLLVFSLAACKDSGKGESAFDAKDINDPKVANLPGSWRHTQMSLAALTENQQEGNAVFSSTQSRSEGSVMVLAKDGNYYTTQPGQAGLKKWEFVAPNVVKLSGNATNEITITELNGDTLKGALSLTSPQSGKVVASANVVWVKMPDSTGLGWSDSTIYTWKTRAQAAETEEQVVKRLKSLLSYNAQVAQDAFASGAQSINTDQFQLPFEYYSGSIALKRENPEDDFAKLFAGNKDAHVAYGKLHEAYKKVSYPKTGNYIQEYAQFMKGLADQL